MKILLVDDHTLFREGMRYVLQQLSETTEILQAGNFHDALKISGQHADLDLSLLDLNMPGSEGPASIKHYHLQFPHIPVVVVSGDDSPASMEKVMTGGAMGFISKSASAPVMLGALNLVLSGGVYIPPQMLLQHGVRINSGVAVEDAAEAPVDRRRMNTNEYGLTPRQMEILKLLAEGMSNKQIASTTSLAEGTVKIHVAAVFQILRVNSRMEAVRIAEQLGLIRGATHG